MLKYQLAVKAHLDLLMSPLLFPFSLQRPAPVAGCLFAGAVASRLMLLLPFIVEFEAMNGC